MADKFSPLLFRRKTDETYQRARSFTRREMETFVNRVQLEKVDEDDESEVFELFGAKILKGVADELMNYFPADSYRNSIEELAYRIFNEAKENNKPTLREAQDRVALIVGQKKLNEGFSSVDEERDAVENFCVLMDWEVKPEDVLHCVKNADGNFTMQLEDGTRFTYDPANDYIV